MGALKRIRVRKATMHDIGLFRKLWKSMLEEQYKAGSLILPNDHNVKVMETLFEAYVNEDLQGVVLLVSDVGILMYGDMANPQQLSIGDKVAYGFGQYVAPENRGKGILDKMAETAFKQLIDMGFDVMVGNTMIEDTHGDEAYARVVKQSGFEVESTGERPNFVRLKE